MLDYIVCMYICIFFNLSQISMKHVASQVAMLSTSSLSSKLVPKPDWNYLSLPLLGESIGQYNVNDVYQRSQTQYNITFSIN